jgi:hypothetical protein
MIREGFAVIGCPCCGQMQIFDLTHATKTCICGYKIVLTKTKLFAVSDSADDARAILKCFIAPKNSKFVSAAGIRGSFLSGKTSKKDKN